LVLDTEFNIEKDDESVQDKELRQARQLVRMVVDSDEFHLHESGDVFIEDLTDYVPAWIVASDAEPPIAGVVFDEVEEGEWCDATPEQTILASEYGPERFETVTSDAQMAREAANAEVVIDPDEAREYSVAAEFVTGMDPGRRTTHPERTLVGPSR
jgi:hypothetical protein